MSISIRTMSPLDLARVVDWAAGEGWNPGLHDVDAFYATDPEGFFIAEENGEAVAAISTVCYDESFAFLGFYIVPQMYRGRGYGMQIWRHAIQYAGSRNIGLDGVVEQQDNYRKSGFRYAWGNQRFSGRADSFATKGLLPYAPEYLKALLAYDRACFPCARTAFMTRWLAQPGSTTLLSFADTGSLDGFGMIRPCHDGYKIAPLFANDRSVAHNLMCGLVNSVAGEIVYLDVPLPNEDAVALAESFGMEPVFETARMYTGPDPKVAAGRIFGVTSFELG